MISQEPGREPEPQAGECQTCRGIFSRGCQTCRGGLVKILGRQAYGVHSADLAAKGCADPVAAFQELADAGHSLRYRKELSDDGVLGVRVWFATNAPDGLPVVPPSSEFWHPRSLTLRPVTASDAAWASPTEREAA